MSTHAEEFTTAPRHTGREDKWRACVVCRHLRIEHVQPAPEGGKCDVFEPDNDDNLKRCPCSGFRLERRGVRR